MQGICKICRKSFEFKKFKGMQYTPMVCSANCLKQYLKENKKYLNLEDMRLRVKDSGVQIFYNMSTGVFRSKIEEKSAKFFTKNNIEYEFEEASMLYRKKMYLPDFYLPEYATFVEIKDTVWEAGAYSKLKLFEKKIPLILITKQILMAWSNNE